ncbi:hypothetical protein DFH09DRAFT_1323514 [Mycena vulgaris]|nr:hypothetical protein DFH09DRAFT_1323514 [Mycena vulgaris]
MCLEPTQPAASEVALAHGTSSSPPLFFAESAARRRTPSSASTPPPTPSLLPQASSHVHALCVGVGKGVHYRLSEYLIVVTRAGVGRQQH